jgi:hypothetical protein
MRSLVIVAILAGTAAASPDVAVAVNAPTSWFDAGSIAASAYLGLAEHQALRVNAATYAYTLSTPMEAVIAALGGEDEASRSGRFVDVSAGWMYFSNRLWSGFTVELAVLGRTRDTTIDDSNASPQRVRTTTHTLAGRALIGWSWSIYDRAFIAVAGGLSAGYEAGSETTDPMTMTHTVGRSAVNAEGYLRLGFAFGR